MVDGDGQLWTWSFLWRRSYARALFTSRLAQRRLQKTVNKLEQAQAEKAQAQQAEQNERSVINIKMAATMAKVKICGIKTKDDLTAVSEAKADWVGFVFFEKSPRNLTLEQARQLRQHGDRLSRSAATKSKLF